MLLYKNEDELVANNAHPFKGQVALLADTGKKKVYDGEKWVPYKKSLALEGPPTDVPTENTETE